MTWDEFYQYIEPIAGRRGMEYRPMLHIVGFKWEQEKFKQEQQGGEASDVVSPFKYIKGRYSPYGGIGVYAYIINAMEKGQRIIRLGPANVKVEATPNSYDRFNEFGEAKIPYFLEAIRFDEVLQEHLEITREQEILVITINTE